MHECMTDYYRRQIPEQCSRCGNCEVFMTGVSFCATSRLLSYHAATLYKLPLLVEIGRLKKVALVNGLVKECKLSIAYAATNSTMWTFRALSYTNQSAVL